MPVPRTTKTPHTATTATRNMAFRPPLPLSPLLPHYHSAQHISKECTIIEFPPVSAVTRQAGALQVLPCLVPASSLPCPCISLTSPVLPALFYSHLFLPFLSRPFSILPLASPYINISPIFTLTLMHLIPPLLSHFRPFCLNSLPLTDHSCSIHYPRQPLHRLLQG